MSYISIVFHQKAEVDTWLNVQHELLQKRAGQLLIRSKNSNINHKISPNSKMKISTVC